MIATAKKPAEKKLKQGNVDNVDKAAKQRLLRHHCQGVH